jgi:hypothetical protein
MRRALTMLLVAGLLGCPDGWTPGGTLDEEPTPGEGCEEGTDLDGDGYGHNCPDGEDCDDTDPAVNPGASEVCDEQDNDCDDQIDEGVLNECGTCHDGCFSIDDGPFPDPDADPGVESDGTGVESNDLVLDQTEIEYSYLWIANSSDLDAGTVSKVDADLVSEIGRYYTTTCFSNPGTPECDDIYGNLVQTTYNYPSRTAVDYNFDVWVANRAFYGGTPSVTKILNEPADCVDRNYDGLINTSADHDGDGQIDTDCNDDGLPDDLTVICTNGLPPEFLGLDDECVLFTVVFGEPDAIGRSMCLDAGDLSPDGVYVGPGNAWACTNDLSPNTCTKFDGTNGVVEETVELPVGVLPYGCAVDGEGILWANGGYTSANLAWIDTADPSLVSTISIAPPSGTTNLYGITVDQDNNLWLADYAGHGMWRYEPDRTDFTTLGDGVWSFGHTNNDGICGIAADDRGYIWGAEMNASYVVRVDPTSIPSGGSVTPTLERWGTYGSDLRGVGVDFSGNVWAIIRNESKVYRLDVDANGDVIDPVAGEVAVGVEPYTYSDFTGFGLRTFTNPHGWWSITLQGCNGGDAQWDQISWMAYEPTGTTVLLRVRSSQSATTFPDWSDTYDTSPADLDQPPQGPLDPNPAPYLNLKFELYSDGAENTPVVSSLAVTWTCL